MTETLRSAPQSEIPRVVPLEEILANPRQFMNDQRITTRGYPQISVITRVSTYPTLLDGDEYSKRKPSNPKYADFVTYVLHTDPPETHVIEEYERIEDTYPRVTIDQIFYEGEKLELLPHTEPVEVTGVISGVMHLLHIE
jgi:hypothetical protein